MRKLIIALALAASCQPAVAKGVNDEKISVIPQLTEEARRGLTGRPHGIRLEG